MSNHRHARMMMNDVLRFRADQYNNDYDPSLLPGAYIELDMVDMRLNTRDPISTVMRLGTSNAANAFIGPDFSFMSSAAAVADAAFGIPMCSCCSSSNDLSNKVKYPYFFRMISPDVFPVVGVVQFMKQHGWSQIGVLTVTDSYGSSLLSSIATECAQNNITIKVELTYAQANLPETADTIASVFASSGMTIFFFGGYSDDWAVLLPSLIDNGIFAEGYSWIGSDGMFWTQHGAGSPPGSTSDGAIMYYPIEEYDQNPLYQSLVTEWLSANVSKYPSISLGVYPVASSIYKLNCFEFLAYGFDRLLKSNPNLTLTALANNELVPYYEIPSTFAFPDMNTESGNVVMNAYGDAFRNYYFYNVHDGGNISIFAIYYTATNSFTYLYQNIEWPGSTSVVPSDRITSISCPVGSGASTGPQGSLVCVVCAIGTYNLNGDDLCRPCPTGAYCDGGSNVTARAGYWEDWSLGNTTTPTFRQCLTSDCCPTGRCTSSNPCSASTTGAMCRVCRDGYAMWGSGCIACSRANAGVVILFLIYGMVIALGCLLCPLKSTNVVIPLIWYYQLSTFMVYSTSIKGFLQAVLFFDINGFYNINKSLPCPFWTGPMGSIYAKYGWIAIILVEYFVAWVGVGVLKRRYKIMDKPRSSAKKPAIEHIERNFVCGLFTFIQAFYVPLVYISIDTMNCERLFTGVYLLNYPSIKCGSEEHIPLLVLASLVELVVVFALPVWCWTVLRRSRTTTDDRASVTDQVLRERYERSKAYLSVPVNFACLSLLVIMASGYSTNTFRVLPPDTLVIGLCICVVAHTGTRSLKTRESHIRLHIYLVGITAMSFSDNVMIQNSSFGLYGFQAFMLAIPPVFETAVWAVKAWMRRRKNTQQTDMS
ncbi:periplasmic binding protein-like I [Polychytrium aggregatum]|uniref:periplasmic binding protein-like I n=1 Tax=Polychytrium aggregatum TaxID=110093 RepID=UPI0022FEFA40|nr:periplasmic binding protein-like I [Polychytrium aggregatum]KAI9205533.1 periplasmic binding protein-like I [Polychytrium aggregatum]